MSFRSDDDARVARADALQRDLDETQEELSEVKRKLAAAEAEKTRLLGERVPPGPTLSKPKPSTPSTWKPAPAYEDYDATFKWVVLGIIVFILLIVVGRMFHVHLGRRSY